MPLSAQQRTEIKRRVYEDLNRTGHHSRLITLWTYAPKGYHPHMYTSEQLGNFCNKLPHPIAKQMALIYLDHVKNILNTPVRPKAIQRFFDQTDPDYATAKQNLQNAVEPDFWRIYHYFRNIINPSEHEWVDDNDNTVSNSIYGYPDGTKIKDKQILGGFDLTRFIAEHVFPELFCDAVNAVEAELTVPSETKETYEHGCFLIKDTDHTIWFSASLEKMAQIHNRMKTSTVALRETRFTAAFGAKEQEVRLDFPEEVFGENVFSYDMMRWTPAKTTVSPYCFLRNFVNDSVIDDQFPP